METTWKVRREVAVITLGSSPNDSKLASHVRRADGLGYANLLIDLTRVRYLDSRNLGELLMYKELAQRRGGDLKLCNLKSRVAEVLDGLHLDRVFEIFDDERSALASFPESLEGEDTDEHFPPKASGAKDSSDDPDLVEIYSGCYRL